MTSMAERMEKHEFRAQSKRLLDLMVNSIYIHREIFLREIISNASDAIDKLSYLSLTDQNVGLRREDFEIRLTLDKPNRTLTVSDNGIGMDEYDLEDHLGVIAGSGSLAFRQQLEQAGTDEAAKSALIGQFGVGFYSAFMVSDHITVITRKYGQTQAWRWESDGVDGYTVAPAQRDSVGTDVIMHIRPDGEEKDEFDRYLREYTIYKLVRKYSDYIRFPIRMLMPQPQLKPGSTKEHPEFEEVFELETFNSMVPLWQRKRGEVTREEYDKFYQEQFADPAPPQRVITVSAEGAVTYKALLYLPSKAPAKYHTDEFKPGLRLYSAGVLVMEQCPQLLPEEFDFICGVVESPDLSLNISRELLQHDRQLSLIRASLGKKIKAELERMLRDDRPAYETFWKNFGFQLKLIALDNYGAKKDALQDLLLFWSNTRGQLITLAEYANRMPPDQKYIYYAVGPTVKAIERMPQTELLREHGYEILCFTERTDEFISDMFRTYAGKPFRSAADGDLGLDEEKTQREDKAHKKTFEFIKQCLGDRVTQVQASARLKNHPVCLSSGKGITFDMERYLSAVQPQVGMKAKRILELNVEHPAFLRLEKACTSDPARAKKYAEILYQQALLIAGLPIEDPTAYTDLLCTLFV